ncbi:response regulator [Streptomyces monticola]|uniref:Response regulator n=1 Tax=Streptomyces monticola TaxID=2666263 RepID=A0ABW2JTT1_9ACTN
MTGPARISARALVVASDPHSRDLLTLSLRLAGCDVATARSGVEALNAAWSQRLDLLVLDPDLPDLDGHEVARILRRDGPDIPVVFAARPLRLEAVVGEARLHLTTW